MVYLDPRSTGVGQVISFAANFAAGGDMTNLAPGFEYFSKLHKGGSVLRVEGTTPYAKFVKGEIPIWISYENDGLKAKYVDGLGDDVEVVIPKEASVAAPYAISLVKNGPNPDAGKLWLQFRDVVARPGDLCRRLRASLGAGRRLPPEVPPNCRRRPR